MQYKIKDIGHWVLSLCLFLTGCETTSPEKEKKEENTCMKQTLQEQLDFYTVMTEPVREQLQLTGQVEYNTDKVVHFVSLVDGITVNTYFSLGDRVQRGQLLAEVRSASLSSLEAERKSLEGQFRVASRQLESVQSMYADAMASHKDLLSAQSDLETIKADLEKVRANLSMFSASTERNVFQIKAPSTGFVVAKNITAGMQIAGGEPLFTISDLSEVWVNVNIYAGNVSQVHEQMPVSITTMSYPGSTFEGKISALPKVFDSDEHVLKARVVMQNQDMRLMPGMLADVAIQKRNNTHAPAIPAKALIFDDNRSFVVLSAGACDLTVREVQVLAKNNGTIYLSQGVEAGDQVVMTNNLLAYEKIKTAVK